MAADIDPSSGIYYPSSKQEHGWHLPSAEYALYLASCIAIHHNGVPSMSHTLLEHEDVKYEYSLLTVEGSLLLHAGVVDWQ